MFVIHVWAFREKSYLCLYTQLVLIIDMHEQEEVLYTFGNGVTFHLNNVNFLYARISVFENAPGVLGKKKM